MELARNLRKDPVSRLEPTPPRIVGLDAKVAQAVEMMRRESVGCVLVCDREGKLLGLFTERDLMCRVLAVGKSLNLPITEVMTSEPVTIKPKDSIRIAVRTMKSGGYRHVPVVDDDHRPVGILSVKRVVHYLVEHYPAAVYNQPPDPGSAPASAEGA